MAAPAVRAAGVFDVLEPALRSDPQATALVCRSGRMSYEALDAAADRAAGALWALAVRPGDRVAVSMPNDAGIIAAFHGAMRLGAVWVGVNSVLAPPEKLHILSDSGASIALLPDEDCTRLSESAATLVGPKEWDDALAASQGRPDVPLPDPNAPAAIAYTSGTTGLPKGAVHCQAGLLLPGAATVARRGWGPDLVKGDSLPLTILNMLVLTTLLTAQAGGTGVIMDRADVASIVGWIERERVQVWNGPPAQLWTMVRDHTIRPESLASLTEVWVGGADCPDSLRADFELRFSVPVTRTYGLTEAPALVALDDLGAGAQRPSGTSGRPLDHLSLSIDNGEIVLSPCTSGPWEGAYRPFLGYWGRPGTAPEGRALRTGDLGSTEGGHLRVAGRRSTVILRGGANVYPAEVERVLATAPGVGACAVAGVPDERLGERVGAVIEPSGGSHPVDVDVGAVLAHCRDNLAAYKVPERLRVIDKLPRNAMGKVPYPAVVQLLTSDSAVSPYRKETTQ